MDQATKPVTSSDADFIVSGRDGDLAAGWSLAEGPVRPVGVVVVGVFAEGVAEMSWAGDEEAVGALAPRAGDPPLADRVRARRLDGCPDNPHAGCGEDGVERAGVLGIAVPDQEPQAVSPLTEVHERVPGLLHCPGGGRVGGDAGQVHAPMVVLDDEQHVEPAQEDGVDMEEVRPRRSTWPGRTETASSWRLRVVVRGRCRRL